MTKLQIDIIFPFLLQKQNDSFSKNLEYNQKEIEKNLIHISELQRENEKLKFNLKEKENICIIKNQEELHHLQESIKKINDERISEERRLKQIITNLQNDIEHHKIDNSQLNQEKM